MWFRMSLNVLLVLCRFFRLSLHKTSLLFRECSQNNLCKRVLSSFEDQNLTWFLQRSDSVSLAEERTAVPVVYLRTVCTCKLCTPHLSDITTWIIQLPLETQKQLDLVCALESGSRFQQRASQSCELLYYKHRRQTPGGGERRMKTAVTGAFRAFMKFFNWTFFFFTLNLCWATLTTLSSPSATWRTEKKQG